MEDNSRTGAVTEKHTESRASRFSRKTSVRSFKIDDKSDEIDLDAYNIFVERPPQVILSHNLKH